MTWRWAVLLGLGFVASCGGTKDGPRGRADPLTTTQGICERWAKAACNDDVVRSCNGSNGTTEQCVDDQTRFCETKLVGADFDRILAQDCIDEVGESYEDGEITAEEREHVVTVESGPCAELAASGNTSGGYGGEGGGGTAPLRPKVGGADCDPSTDVCVDTHYCDPAVNICRLKAAVNETCCDYDPRYLVSNCGPDSAEVPCQSGAYCGSEGVCLALGGEDDTCVDGTQCRDNYFCSSSGTCQPLGQNNAVCESDDECAPGFFCSESFEQCRDFIVVGTPELCGNLGA